VPIASWCHRAKRPPTNPAGPPSGTKPENITLGKRLILSRCDAKLLHWKFTHYSVITEIFSVWMRPEPQDCGRPAGRPLLFCAGPES